MTLPMSLTRRGAHGRDDAGDGGLRLVLRHLLRHEGLDDGDLVALGLGQFGPAALLIGRDQFLALLHHLGEELDDAGIGGQRRVMARRCGC